VLFCVGEYGLIAAKKIRNENEHKCCVVIVIRLARELTLTIMQFNEKCFLVDLILTFAFKFLQHFVRRAVAGNWIEFIVATHRFEAIRSAQHNLTVGDTCIDSNVVLAVRVVFALE
jgi:hypothetical protein